MRAATRTLGLVVALLAGGPLAGQSGPGPREPRFIDVRQGTDLSLTTVPGADFIVIELLGRLWRLPVSGGAALPLTGEEQSVRHPRLSADAQRVVYQRLSPAGWDIWLLDLETQSARAVTDAPGNEREPDFLPGGDGIVFAADRSGQFDLWSVATTGGTWTPVSTEAGNARFPHVADNGAIVYVVETDAGYALRVRADGLTNTLYTTANTLDAPAWRPGGGVIVFQERRPDGDGELRMALLAPELLLRSLSSGEDLFSARVAWLDDTRFLYAADGQIWQRRLASRQRRPVHLFATAIVPAPERARIEASAGAALTPFLQSDFNGSATVLAVAGDIWLHRDDTLQKLTDDAFWNEDPLLDPAGRFVIFARNHAGERRLWQLALEPGARARALTPPGERAFAGALDAAGARLAWLTNAQGFSALAPSRVNTLYLEDGTRRHSEPLRMPALGPPHWLEDNRDAMVNLAVRQPDGTQALVAFDAALRRVDSSAGTEAPPQGRQSVAIDAEILQRIGAEGAAAPAETPRRYVIQAGRLFDGVGTDYRRHVDIHIEADRITAVVARGRLPLPADVVDATELTVLPGLIDSHTHDMSLLGELAGRAWLSFGVTTVRVLEPPTPAQQALEAAWASGRLPGPRVVRLPGPPVRRDGADLQAPPALFDDPFVVPPGEPPGIAWPGTLLPPLPAVLPALPVRRYSPGQRHYQDVYSLQAAAGAAEITSLASFAPGATRRILTGNAALRRTFERLFAAPDAAAWLDAEPLLDGLPSRQVALTRFLRAGTQLVIGSEGPHTPPGLGAHIELALLADAGVPGDQVLRAATSVAALALGLEQDVGTLEAGRRADLVIVAGDPLDSIEAALEITAVVRDGRWIERTALLDPAVPGEESNSARP